MRAAGLHRRLRLAVKIVAALAAAIPFTATAPAWAANTWDLISRSIPASACEVRDSQQAAKVELVAGGWRFAGATIGKVTLSCPLPIQAFPADMSLLFNTTVMDFYRVWYRDSDGPANVTSVKVIPYLRTDLGVLSNIGLFPGGGGIVPPGVCQFNSNSYPHVVFAANIRDCNHAIQLNALYWFEVTLERNATTQTVEFHGIDFWNTTAPPG